MRYDMAYLSRTNVGVIDSDQPIDAFVLPLQRFSEYLTAQQSQPAHFEPNKLLEIMNLLIEPMPTYFRNRAVEIADVAHYPKLDLLYGDHSRGTNYLVRNLSVGLKRAFVTWLTKALGGGGKLGVVQFILLNHDCYQFEGGLWYDWPPVWMVTRWLHLNHAAWLGSGTWRFASCDTEGYPRELYAFQSLRTQIPWPLLLMLMSVCCAGLVTIHDAAKYRT